MEEIKKQILLINLANYNEKVNNVSKFKLNDKEVNLFCDIMQQFAEKYHAEQLRIHDVGQQRELLKSFADWLQGTVWDDKHDDFSDYVEDYIKTF